MAQSAEDERGPAERVGRKSWRGEKVDQDKQQTQSTIQVEPYSKLNVALNLCKFLILMDVKILSLIR